jgi:hypothetical protein
LNLGFLCEFEGIRRGRKNDEIEVGIECKQVEITSK